jgi:hypothetical protein
LDTVRLVDATILTVDATMVKDDRLTKPQLTIDD